MQTIRIRYETEPWFRPRVCREYTIDKAKARICRKLYGWGNSNFWACLDNVGAIIDSRPCD